MNYRMTGSGAQSPDRLGAGERREPNAEDLLAELRQVLQSTGRFPDEPSSGAMAPAPTPIVEPRRSADIDTTPGDLDRVSAGPRITIQTGGVAGGSQLDSAPEASRVGSRRQKLVGSGLALCVAAAGAALLLMPSSRPPVVQPAATLADVESPAVDNGSRFRLAPTASADGAVQDSATPTPAPFVAEPPAYGSNAVGVTTTSLTAPAPAPVAAGSQTASEAPPPPPAPQQSEPVKSEATPAPGPSSNVTEPTSASATPTPPARPAAEAAAKAEPAKPPAAKTDASTKPTAIKAPAKKKVVAKIEKPKAEAAALTSNAPVSLAQPSAAGASAVPADAAPAAAAEPAPAAAPPAPAASPSFAEQSVGKVTQAFGYLAHLPGALIGRAAGSNGDSK
jgi:hypothetical protein